MVWPPRCVEASGDAATERRDYSGKFEYRSSKSETNSKFRMIRLRQGYGGQGRMNKTGDTGALSRRDIGR